MKWVKTEYWIEVKRDYKEVVSLPHLYESYAILKNQLEKARQYYYEKYGIVFQEYYNGKSFIHFENEERMSFFVLSH